MLYSISAELSCTAGLGPWKRRGSSGAGSGQPSPKQKYWSGGPGGPASREVEDDLWDRQILQGVGRQNRERSAQNGTFEACGIVSRHSFPECQRKCRKNGV